MKKYFSVLVFLLCTAIESHAATPYTSNWGMNVGQLSVDKDIQQEFRLGDEAIIWGAHYNRYFADHFNFYIAIDIIDMEDDDTFSVRVVDQNDNRSTETSDVTGTAIPIEIGTQLFFFENSLELGINYGMRFYDVDRGVNCTNCSSENVDIDNDKYLKPFLRYRFANKYYLGLFSNISHADNGLSDYIGIDFGYTRW